MASTKKEWHHAITDHEIIQPGDSIREIQRKAGLLWTAEKAALEYTAGGNSLVFDGRQVIYRSDTHAPLGVTSDHRYNIVQPAEVMEFFDGFLKDNGLSIETAGSLRGGRLIWCLAKLGKDYDFLMPGKDRIDSYVRLQTSFDGSRATDLVATTIRQVCWNTMSMINPVADRIGYKVPHSAKFDAKSLQAAFGLLGEQHRITSDVWNALIKRKVTQAETAEFFCNVLGIEAEEIGKTDKHGKKLVSTRSENMLKELAAAYAQGPGADLKSAKGTAFGLLQAVTYWVDHKAAANDNYDDGKEAARRHAAWYGIGEATKQDAQYLAAELAGVESMLEAA